MRPCNPCVFSLITKSTLRKGLPRRRRRYPDAEDHAEVRVEDAEPRAAVYETADERRGVAEPEEGGRDRGRGIVGEDARVVPAARDGWFIAQDAAGDVPGR